MKNRILKKLIFALIAAVAGSFLLAGCSEDAAGEGETKKAVKYAQVSIGGKTYRYVNTLEVKKAKATLVGTGEGFGTAKEKNTTISGNIGGVTFLDVPVGKYCAVEVQAYKGDVDAANIVTGEVLYGYIVDMRSGENSIKVDQTTSAKGKIYYECIKEGCTEAQMTSKLTSAFLANFESVASPLVKARDIAAAVKAGSLAAASTYIEKTGSVEFNITKSFNGTAVNGRSVSARAASQALTMYFQRPEGFVVWFWEDGGLASAELMGFSWSSPSTTAAVSGHEGWSYITIPADKMEGGHNIKFMPNKQGEVLGKSETFWVDSNNKVIEKPAGWDGAAGGGGSPSTPTPSTPTDTEDAIGLSAGTVIYISDPLSSAYTVKAKTVKTRKEGTNEVMAEEKANGTQYELIIYGIAPGTWDVYKRTPGNYGDEKDVAANGFKSGTFSKMGSVTVASNAETAQGVHGVNLVEAGTEIEDTKPTPPSPPSSGGGGGSDDDTPQTPTESDSSAVATEYYWTNKNGAVGTEKTISSFTDWTAAERIAQCAAYDDPRTWRGIQESPYDCYAIYAAFDDTNLYLMVELTNCATAGRASFMNHDYAGGDNSDWDNRDIPLGWIFNTGKGPKCVKDTTEKGGKPIWDAVKFSDSQGFNYLTYHSSKCDMPKQVVGTPGWFKSNGTSFDYDAAYTTTYGDKGNGVTVKYQPSLAVSSKVWFEATPTGNRAESNQTAQDLMSSTNYRDAGKATGSKDCSYWYTIPYTALGIDKAWLKSNGIGVRQLTTGGGSLMDCCPWDPAMVDVVNQPYSCDESTSAEKEDEDTLTTPQARVGHM